MAGVMDDTQSKERCSKLRSIRTPCRKGGRARRPFSSGRGQRPIARGPALSNEATAATGSDLGCETVQIEHDHPMAAAQLPPDPARCSRGGRRLERLFVNHPRYQNRLCALRRRPALEPATPAVPTATEKNQHNDEDYKKCCRVHAVLLARLPTEAAPILI